MSTSSKPEIPIPEIQSNPVTTVPTGSDAGDVNSDDPEGPETGEEIVLRPTECRPVLKLSVKLIDTYKHINKVSERKSVLPLQHLEFLFSNFSKCNFLSYRIQTRQFFVLSELHFALGVL